MSALTPADVDATLATMHFNAEERGSAIRALKRLQKECSSVTLDDDTISRYLALRSLKGPCSRITAQQLRSVQKTESKTSSLKQRFWIMDKRRCPQLPLEMDLDLIVDSHRLLDFPPGLGKDDVWVIDQACPLSVLGPGALEWETKVATTMLLDHGSGNSSSQQPPGVAAWPTGPVAASSEAGSVVVAATPAAAPAPGVGPRAAAESSRLLHQCNSDTEQPEELRRTAMQEAKLSKASSQQKRTILRPGQPHHAQE